DMVLVIQADPDEFLWMCDGCVKPYVGALKKERLNTAGRPLELTQLFFEQSQPLFGVKGFFDGECDPRKFQKVIADGLGNIKTGIAEDAAETNHIRRIFAGKIHEFHRKLL